MTGEVEAGTVCTRPRVEITYCSQCRFVLRATWLTQELLMTFDTDLGNDVDDAMALAVIHALESRGECELLCVTLTKDNRPVQINRSLPTISNRQRQNAVIWVA